MEIEENSTLFYTYILQSISTEGLYIGYTTNVEKRLWEHNNNIGKFTSSKGPWVVLYYKKFDIKEEALSMERKLKKWKSKVRIMEWIEREKKKTNQ